MSTLDFSGEKPPTGAEVKAASDDNAPLYKAPVTGNEVWPDGTAYVVVTPTDVCMVWTPDWNDAKAQAGKVWETVED